MTPKQALKIIAEAARHDLRPLYPRANMIGFNNPSNINARARIAKVNQAIETLEKAIKDHESIQKQFIA